MICKSSVVPRQHQSFKGTEGQLLLFFVHHPSYRQPNGPRCYFLLLPLLLYNIMPNLRESHFLINQCLFHHTHISHRSLVLFIPAQVAVTLSLYPSIDSFLHKSDYL